MTVLTSKVVAAVNKVFSGKKTISESAKELGIAPSTMRNRMDKLQAEVSYHQGMITRFKAGIEIDRGLIDAGHFADGLEVGIREQDIELATRAIEACEDDLRRLQS